MPDHKIHIRIIMWIGAIVMAAIALSQITEDGKGLILYIVLNAVVIYTAYIVAKLVNPGLNGVDRFIAVFVITAGLIAVVELGLGLLHMLSLVPVLSAHLILLSLALFLRGRRDAEKTPSAWPELIQQLLKNRLCLIIGVVACALLLRQFIFAMIQPPTWWDTLAHHLPVPAHWLQTQSLALNPAFGLFTYPYNSELFFLWSMLPFHGELAVNLVQLIFLFLLIASVISIGRNMGLSTGILIVTSGLYLLSPTFLEQTTICYNEIIITSLFMTAIAFWLRYYRTGNISDILFGAIPFALFLGADFLSLLYAPIAVGFILLVIILRRTSPAQVIKAVCILAAITVLLGSFWYVRNLVVEGNPFYPLQISLFGRIIFHGEQVISQTNIVEYDSFAYSMFESTGRLFGLSIMLSLIFSAIAVIRARCRVHAAFFLMPLMFVMTWYFILPVREIRYLMFVVPVASVAAATLIEKGTRCEKHCFLVLVLGLLILQSAAWVPNYWYVLWILAAIASISVWNGKKTAQNICRILKGASRGQVMPLAVVAISVAVLLVPVLQQYRSSIRYTKHYNSEVGEAWQWIEKETKNVRIACTGTNKSYPLFRPDLSNCVTYIETDLPADRMAEEGGHHCIKWFGRMLSSNIDYLFVCRMDASTYMDTCMKYPTEKHWADAYGDIFHTAFRNDYVTIYEVNRKQLLVLVTLQQKTGTQVSSLGRETQPNK